ncbi:hypothetical protein DM01DRAFT_1128668 [Hesseltinella vesiculosa]|uniref:Cas12f1-like TNB domain-containing protein n=1 Tax=Hesseltinella vesiculosa TaxID=101127 RepID=A0A1X2GUQ5_9FUNG|nr:hypothetical protein DM01DRAFT_1128668 [Hesseltinella vesiculosa]
MQRFHEPIRGIGLRRQLKRLGFTVYLIDEYLTSQVCPKCSRRSLEHIGYVSNPRPFRDGQVRRWGQVHCQTCPASPNVRRTWNRDLMATLNMTIILLFHRFGLGRPLVYSRGQHHNV